MINVDTETERLVHDYIEALKKAGDVDEATRIESSDFSSTRATTELLPKIDALRSDLGMRNAVLEKMQVKRDIAMSTNNYGELAKLDKAILEVEKGDYTNPIAKRYKKEIDTETARKERIARREISAMSLQDIINHYNFHIASTGKLMWYYQSDIADDYGNREWLAIPKETLQANFSALNVYIRGREGEPDYNSFVEFNEKLVDQGRTFKHLVQSYTTETGNGYLNIMNRQFCPREETGATDYHWIIDAMLESISGATQEDKDPKELFERSLLCKYLHPENPFVPSLLINDHGTSGKGVTNARFLPTLFAGNVADNLTIEHLTGKFNGVIAGKIVVIVNEAARDKVDSERVKAFVGSPRFWVENKYERPYECDNNALVIITSNPKGGSLTLSGENSDRRYNLFSTKRTIYEVICEYAKRLEGRDMTEDEARDWLEDEGQWIAADKVEVGKWLNAKIVQYGDVKHVRAVKNDVYVKTLEEQRAGWLKSVEDVFEDTNFTYIREQLLRDLILEYNKSERFKPGRNTMMNQILDLIKARGYSVELVHRCKINGKGGQCQRTVWRRTDLGNVIENETNYGNTDQSGRWIWTWSA